ncbi:MAG: hypothetical protein KOO60_07550 [Gemmatimonadales bacterium]|nr:hypothetical protein [Gemmatimonadales bacterium]
MTMRVTDSYLSSILVRDLNQSLGRLLKYQQMAGSMRRVNSFADDPRAVGSIQRYNDLITNNQAYIKNVERSRIIVDGTDIALQGISSILADVRVISLRESSAIATDQSMKTSVIEVDNLMNQLLDVLNTTVEGNYLFSGQRIHTPAFERSGSTVLYQGDDKEIQSRTGPNSTMPVNIPGNIFMGSQSAILTGAVSLAPRLELLTPLTDINAGSGWESGSISLDDGLGNNYVVDLAGSLTIGDVITNINTATGGTITAGLRADGSGLELTGTGPLTVSEVGEGSTASSLGFYSFSEGGIYTGGDIRTAADETTNLADIENLASSLPLGLMDVTYQGTTYSVDLSAATTMGDLVTTFNATVPGMELQIRDSSIALISGSPESFLIENADATNTATVLGLAGAGSPVRLFGMLEDLKTALMSEDKEAIRGASHELSSIEDTIYQLMMRNGGRQTNLDWADRLLRQRDERLQGNLALEYDADVAAVAAELSRAETSYQASLLVTSRLYEANLMQYLR